jgi:hypothetical protein
MGMGICILAKPVAEVLKLKNLILYTYRSYYINL